MFPGCRMMNFCLTLPYYELIIFNMRNKILLVFVFLFVGFSGLFARELSGTYDKDFTVKTEFNTISKDKTLHVTKGATYVMTDAIVEGSIIVDKGSSLIAPKDNEGYLVFKPGTHVEGIDLYYKVRVSEDLVFTRKFPMTLDQVWNSGNQQLIDWVGIIEFCYSSALKGWVSINEIRYMNPFNENLFEDYDIVFTQSASKRIEKECRSLIVKNKSKVVVQPDQGYWNTIVNESIIIEEGSSLLGTDANGHKLVLKKGIKIQGLPLYVRFQNELIAVNTILSDLWTLPVFTANDNYILFYDPDLKGWVFQDILITEKDIPDALLKKIRKLK